MSPLWRFVGAALISSVVALGPEGSICSWQEPRAAVVRDTLYVEGGIFSAVKNGTCKIVTRQDGSLYAYNFSYAFDASSNVTSLFQPLFEENDPSIPSYVDGFMVADNYEWYSFGGQAYPIVDNFGVNTGIFRGLVYPNNPTATAAQFGVTPNYQPTGNLSSKNIYITNGGGVSVPSESLGFYFSGMRTATYGNISQTPDPVTGVDAPTQLVNTMLKIDTSVYSQASFNNISLPDSIKPRAEATLAWIPTGLKGIVVVIGGVPMSADVPAPGVFGCKLNTTYTQAVNTQGPSFMSNVSLYDVATGKWFVQPTKGTAPPQSAQACAVVATSSDNKTHNIYLYGGFDGIKTASPSDDVWILSLPSFTWVKAASGTASHGRYSHVCAKPYPDQMMVVGGTTDCGNALSGPIMDVFNLSSLKWQGSYDPSKWSDYVIPSVVSDAIRATPTASMDPALSALFQASYPGTLPRWYPYAKATTNSNTSGNSGSGSQQPWLIPVAVVIPIAAVVIGIASCFFCPCCLWYRRRKGGSTRSSHHRISLWRRELPPQPLSERSEDDSTQVDSPHGMAEVFGDTYFKPMGRLNVAELNDNSNHSLNSGNASSPYTSAQSHTNPGRSVLSAELPGENAPLYELPADLPTSNTIKTPVIKNHPMYPPSLGDHVSSIGDTRSISSPSSEGVTPNEGPSSRSRDNITLLPPPNDMVLSQHSNSLHPSRATTSAAKPPFKPRPASSNSTDISPELNPVNISPELAPVQPTTPPAQVIRSQRPSHHRNVSSLSSNLEDLASVSPSSETRRSNTIAALPDYPHQNRRSGHIDGIVSPATATSGSPVDRHGIDTVVSPASATTSPVRPYSDNFDNRDTRRHNLVHWPPHREVSAYDESKGRTQ